MENFVICSIYKEVFRYDLKRGNKKLFNDYLETTNQGTNPLKRQNCCQLASARQDSASQKITTFF